MRDGEDRIRRRIAELLPLGPEDAAETATATFDAWQAVLHPEDFSCAQDVIRYHLSAMGVDVDMADHGQMACAMAEKPKSKGRPYDLILMDIQMPIEETALRVPDG